VCDNEDGPTLIDKLAHFEDRGLDIREPRSGGNPEGDAVVVDGTGYLNGQPLGRQETWLALQGPHNAQNAAAAIAVASALGVEPGLIA
jgi:UDP-N-acetylmuramoylalanine--D-glutamate ligase